MELEYRKAVIEYGKTAMEYGKTVFMSANSNRTPSQPGYDDRTGISQT
jgi:hypothetical protein